MGPTTHWLDWENWTEEIAAKLSSTTGAGGGATDGEVGTGAEKLTCVWVSDRP